jgi:hypothetical protein
MRRGVVIAAFLRLLPVQQNKKRVESLGIEISEPVSIVLGWRLVGLTADIPQLRKGATPQISRLSWSKVYVQNRGLAAVVVISVYAPNPGLGGMAIATATHGLTA